MASHANSKEERFWRNIIKGSGDECWEWNGSRTSEGYGHFRWHWKFYYAHRVAWEIFHGKISKGMHVLHNCDNPPCVNPKHLRLGTHQENMEDRNKRHGWGKYQDELKL